MMFISSTAYEPGFPAAWEGLDLGSAVDATPRWYGVSSGNGNNGVSHTWPDYYVRTCEPYALAQAALLCQFNSTGYEWAMKNSEVDGEAEFTISATIYNPPDDGEDRDHSECEDGEDCTGCEQCEQCEQCEPESSWCDNNGAWLIVEVFPVDDMDSARSSAMRYDSLDDALSADVVAMARESE